MKGQLRQKQNPFVSYIPHKSFTQSEIQETQFLQTPQQINYSFEFQKQLIQKQINSLHQTLASYHNTINLYTTKTHQMYEQLNSENSEILYNGKLQLPSFNTKNIMYQTKINSSSNSIQLNRNKMKLVTLQKQISDIQKTCAKIFHQQDERIQQLQSQFLKQFEKASNDLQLKLNSSDKRIQNSKQIINSKAKQFQCYVESGQNVSKKINEDMLKVIANLQKNSC